MKSTFVPFVKLCIIILVPAGVLYWLERALNIIGAPVYVLHGGWDTLKEVGMVQN